MTKRRRAHGEGSVYFDAHRAKWVGTIDLGPDPATGKRRRAKVSGDTRSEAADRLRERRKELDAGSTAPANMTTADLIDAFSAAMVPTLTPRTAADVARHLAHARAGLGHVKLKDLRAHHVDAWLLARAESAPARSTDPDARLSRSEIRRSRFTLARALRWGQRKGLVTTNAADLADLPATPEPKDGRALTADELRRLIAATVGTRYHALWVAMAGLGLRPGEARALSWDDVDLDAGIVHVRQALTMHDGRHVIGDVKTPKSRRSLAMPAPVVDAIRAHRKRQAAERLALGAGWPTEWAGLVFVTETGRPYDANHARRDLARFARKAKVGPVRPYDLRHTAATLMAASGARLEAVADVLGHTGITLARSVYVHATAPTVAHAVAPMTEALTGSQDAATGAGDAAEA